ncbi:MAG: trypsin-like peptidase domain-containing protein [Bacteroidota bacterium]
MRFTISQLMGHHLRRGPSAARHSFVRPYMMLGALYALAAGGGWTCSDLSARKPGDESVSVPLDKPAPGTPSGASKPGAVVVPTTPRPLSNGLAPAAALTPRVDPPGEARALSRAFASVARALGPSVVRVDVEVAHPDPDDEAGQGSSEPSQLPPQLRRFFQFGEPPEPGPQRGTGSGVVLDGAGNIVTNRHVVSRASKVSVTLPDGRELSAKVVGADSQTDVAVVRLDKPPAGLVAARLGDSDKLDVGEWVLAVGSPLGLDQTVTAGIVSGKGRVGRHVQMSGERVRRYIQTDAKINPGNSGGPLVNLSAEVVGINTLINTGPGGAYGFAIPINQVRRVAETLIKEGRVRYPYLGVLVGDVKELESDKRAALARAGNVPTTGAFVSDVTPGSPAVKAGLRAGDVITGIDSEAIEGAGDVIDYVSTRAIGAKVQVTFVRDGKKASVSVALAELPGRGGEAPDGTERDDTVFGLSLQTLTPRLAESLGLGGAVAKGAVIVETAAGSPADKASLVPGDVIVEIDRKSIATADDARSALRAQRRGGHLLRVKGAGGARFVTLPGDGGP